MAESKNMEKKPFGDNSSGIGASDTCPEEDTNDVHAHLAQKERDLILAAELGKALLDSNQELQSRYDQMVEEFTRKLENIQQEKYGLHLELEKSETQHQNTVKDLQDDVTSLRKQLQNSDQIESNERERTRSLREAQQTSDYLMEQMRQVSAREEELQKELGLQKLQNETSAATIQDQIDHIVMLREQVEYLSEKLREANQKMIEMQGEGDSLTNALEAANEKLQVLEQELASRDEQIHKQNYEIEELQESNAGLEDQLRRRHQTQYQYLWHPSLPATHNINNSQSGGGGKPAPSSQIDLIENQRSNMNASALTSHNLSHESASLNDIQVNVEKLPEDSDNGEAPLTPDSLGEAENVDHNVNEKSLLAEFSDVCPPPAGEDGAPTSLNPSLSAEASLPLRHRRNVSDGSISSMTEGSRKRHHQNIGGDSEDDDAGNSGDKTGPSSGCKQTLYSKSLSKHHQLPLRTGSDKSRLILGTHSEPSGGCGPLSTMKNELSILSASLEDQDDIIVASEEIAALSVASQSVTSCHKFPMKTNIQRNLSSPVKDFSEPDGECGMITSPADSNEKSLLSELSSQILESGSYSSCPQEQSLFSELSSQLMEDKNGGSCSDSSSTCMLGVFDFSSGQDGQDAEHGTDDLFIESHSRPSRLELEGGSHTDWHNMTCVTADLLDEDDFECDDDDFLVGNLAGTTLSIGDAGHRALHYQYHCFGVEEAETDSRTDALYRNDSPPAKWEAVSPSVEQDAQQEKITQACVQLRGLVLKAQGHPSPSSQAESPEATTPDDLLDLVEQMRLCIDRLTTTQADGQNAQGTASFNTENTVKVGDRGVQEAECKMLGEQQLSPRRRKPEKMSQMRKSKSSSSLHLRMSL